ncbi:MAG: hypothetical protein A2087_11775 [Spirochaetes bacterium GWD1_61_31]|nr:MAG: hypothetical protein A2Y37_04650 [Spirochaetes bacterium GWB1_60_80]OHD34775.1 MAG: hypothetical protein A2004_08645 [Spirochaetes bacterium GWC1_61_12]OHD41713.1 MAG: hypothetical protein A2087_11775 [Spirochaetes bacterium GWD1_61_31]OHD44621.1 MAG: hypothetical protein A2Y35_12040 [Spirochaetes bacterium GWE1_60_18]OHD57945.1 MAG: hypothetical protein A2Y32_04035 [Spirochaetes bacterium GWF1_60_12]HAP43928.1 hypothetical protein [Spirochaetaceae bacterium]
MASDKDRQQRDYLLNRLVKRDRHLAKWAKRTDSDCYRVYDRDIPEIPLVVERYGDAALVALFERPYDKPDDEEAAWLLEMKAAVAEALHLEPDAIYLKTRRRLAADEQYERKCEGPGRLRTVREQGLSFLVNLDEYLDTGLFMDHRPLRQMLRHDAVGRNVLNLYCYTGSFSVYALAGDASRVCAVDLSNTYLAWADENIRLNGLDSSRYQSVRGDVQDYLISAAVRSERFDYIILDPPTFSNSKKMAGFLDVNRHWPQLVQQSAALLAPGGVLYFSTNSRDLRLDASLLAGLACQDISARTIPEDFRPSCHKAWRITRAGSAVN